MEKKSDIATCQSTLSRRLTRRAVAMFGTAAVAAVIGVVKVQEAAAGCGGYCRGTGYCWDRNGRCRNVTISKSTHWLTGRCTDSICACQTNFFDPGQACGGRSNVCPCT